jgi:hypothetical protein
MTDLCRWWSNCFYTRGFCVSEIVSLCLSPFKCLLYPAQSGNIDFVDLVLEV